MSAIRMSKTRAAQMARKARQYGYFSSPPELHVNCPQYHERVTTTRDYREFPARPGQPANVRADGTRYIFRQEKPLEALDRAVTEHLMHWCDAA